MIRERCSCGAEFETDDKNAVSLLKDWRKNHKCDKPFDAVTSSGFAQVEIAPDYTEKELHIGFRYQEDDE